MYNIRSKKPLVVKIQVHDQYFAEEIKVMEDLQQTRTAPTAFRMPEGSIPELVNHGQFIFINS